MADHWSSATQGGFDVAADVRGLLAALAESAPPPEVDWMLTRVAGAIIQVLTSHDEIPSAVRTDVVNVIRAAGRLRHTAIAGAVAQAAWRSSTVCEHLDWCRELARYGEDAAITGREPELLIELLDSSAAVYSSTADWPGAERAWLRAHAVAESLGDAARGVQLLRLLTTNYLNWERPHKAADTLLELVAIHERVGNRVKTAEAQAAVARIMTNAGRADAAIKYLRKADRSLHSRPDTQPELAMVLSDIGHVYAQLGRINTARTYYHEALALVVDTDDRAAEQIRAMQSVLPNGDHDGLDLTARWRSRPG
ncbi:hypothetical protein [Actinophytocola sp.]|uniref:hypothetical protein n=1 Tax=Actinophytocola sp. TaxID=1872138 RepID=UPI00389ADD14